MDNIKNDKFKKIDDVPCPVFKTQKIINGKWKIIILWMLSKQDFRFNELLKTIPEITQSTLTKQLKELAVSDMIKRTSYDEVPPKVVYSLSEKGKAFKSVLYSMEEWGNKYLDL